jgi:hypothetical protein
MVVDTMDKCLARRRIDVNEILKGKAVALNEKLKRTSSLGLRFKQAKTKPRREKSDVNDKSRRLLMTMILQKLSS